MSFLRTILALLLSVSLAGYGMAAASALHAHADGEAFAVHALPDGGHSVDHHSETIHEDQDAEGSEHYESGLHSHSVPQFASVDAGLVTLAAALSSSLQWP
ncbi:MAG: hypothetical protein ACOZAA_04595 [Pseudomonadota bacterium]